MSPHDFQDPPVKTTARTRPVRHTRRIAVRCNDHVDILDCTSESTVHVSRLHLQFESTTVHFVHEQIWNHAHSKSLTKNSLRLGCPTLNAVDNDHSTIGNAESSITSEEKSTCPRGIGQKGQSTAWDLSRLRCRAQGKERLTCS